MKVEIIKRETVKPSSPTPSHLKSFKLSLLDILSPAVYTSVVLFYPNNGVLTSDQTSNHLKKSLSEALTLFYPLAGKIKDNTTIECDDDGAQYHEAKCNGLLSNFLDQHRDEALIKQFLPAATENPEAGTWPLLLVQATFFNCGGVAIGVCASHKFVDAATLSVFLKTFGRVCTAGPDFEAASYFRPGNTFSFAPPASLEVRRLENLVTKRYVFDKSMISALKAKSSSDSVKQPTRVEVVTSLVWRCLIGCSQSRRSGSSVAPEKPRYSILMQATNMRKRVEPPFPQNSVGNLATYFTSQAENKIYENCTDPLECQLQDLVAKLRQGIKEFSENKAKRFRGDGGFQTFVEYLKEGRELFTRNDIHHLICTSWCNFQLYEVDLGSGKPIYVTVPSSIYEDVIVLMDTRDGDGVELLLTLSRENMAFFENQQERFFNFLF